MYLSNCLLDLNIWNITRNNKQIMSKSKSIIFASKLALLLLQSSVNINAVTQVKTIWRSPFAPHFFSPFTVRQHPVFHLHCLCLNQATVFFNLTTAIILKPLSRSPRLQSYPLRSTLGSRFYQSWTYLLFHLFWSTIGMWQWAFSMKLG